MDFKTLASVSYSDGHYTADPQTTTHGPHVVNEALAHLQASTYWITEDATDNWIINSVRVSQTADGLVRYLGRLNGVVFSPLSLLFLV